MGEDRAEERTNKVLRRPTETIYHFTGRTLAAESDFSDSEDLLVFARAITNYIE